MTYIVLMGVSLVLQQLIAPDFLPGSIIIPTLQVRKGCHK